MSDDRYTGRDGTGHKTNHELYLLKLFYANLHNGQISAMYYIWQTSAMYYNWQTSARFFPVSPRAIFLPCRFCLRAAAVAVQTAGTAVQNPLRGFYRHYRWYLRPAPFFAEGFPAACRDHGFLRGIVKGKAEKKQFFYEQGRSKGGT